MKLSSGAVLLAIALLAGCQSSPKVPPSGFLGDYSQLTPAPDREGDKRLPQGEEITWQSRQDVSDYWAKNFRMRLDELRGVPPTA